jgi:hypothetical protein
MRIDFATISVTVALLAGCQRDTSTPTIRNLPVGEQKAPNAQDTLRYWSQMELVTQKNAKNPDDLKSVSLEQDKANIVLIETLAVDLQQIPVQGVDIELLDYSMKVVSFLKELAALGKSVPKGITFGAWIAQHPERMNKLGDESKAVTQAVEPLRAKLAERYQLTFPPLGIMQSSAK